MITKKFFVGTDDLTDAYVIRRQVFIEEQGVPEELERDSFDILSDHVVLYEDEKPVAAGRLVFKGNEYSIGRIAVLKEYRDKKLGAVLVNGLIEKAFLKGINEVHVHSQKQVQGFYEKLGFKAYGDTYFEAGIEHISMVAVKG